MSIPGIASGAELLIPWLSWCLPGLLGIMLHITMTETVVSLSVLYHFDRCHVHMPWIHQSDSMVPAPHRMYLLLVGTCKPKLYIHHCMIGITRQTPHYSAHLNIRSRNILLNPDTESWDKNSRYRRPVSSVWDDSNEPKYVNLWVFIDVYIIYNSEFVMYALVAQLVVCCKVYKGKFVHLHHQVCVHISRSLSW